MAYRVDNVPWPIRPLFLLYAWTLGFILWSFYSFVRLTSRIEYRGPVPLDRQRHGILCLWHECWQAYFVVYWRYPTPHAMINHPAAYMKPIHTHLWFMGLKRLLLGSSGDEGRRAANELAQLIKSGYSSAISPDGPYGPAHVLKKGVLHMSLQSGAPVIPVAIEAKRKIIFKTWDEKKFFFPFNHFIVRSEAPYQVTSENFDRAKDELEEILNRLTAEKSF